SEHVDYWDQLGWKDPHSSASFTARQDAYARQLGTRGPYTPQMVVDGTHEFVGSDSSAAVSAIRSSLHEPKLVVRIVPGASNVTVQVDPFPQSKAHKANVYVVYADDSGSSDVIRGENKGHTLHHVSIARDLRQV